MNVKKSTSLFLALLLLVSNIGMAFNVHYCGDSIAAISLHSELLSLTEPDGCCEKTAVVEKDSCCKDKVVHFEKKSDNATVKIVLFDYFGSFLSACATSSSFCYNTSFSKSGSQRFLCCYQCASALPIIPSIHFLRLIFVYLISLKFYKQLSFEHFFPYVQFCVRDSSWLPK